jgi:hypothetical protein
MPKATPQHLDDPTNYKNYKPEMAGSGIKIEPIPLSKAPKNAMEEYSGASKPSKNMPEGAQTLPYKPNKKAEADMKIVPLAKGGMASRRADGIATKGKTRGTLVAMCGGGYQKGKK